MGNILDYIDWRGDLDFRQSEFNEIDNLILARFSYLPFDNILKQDEIITIKEAWYRFKKLDCEKEKILQKEDMDLFMALAKSNRFLEMKIANYINKISSQEEKQFSAITIFIPDDTIYVSFRGTDNTIIGWKEDFNMSFKEKVPSQLDGVRYLESIGSKYSNLLRIGGHSKGGNIAVYASSFCSQKIQNRIINVYNNDGPGFHEKVIKNLNYQKNISKVHTFVPQSSIIGRLLYHEENYTVVKSKENGAMQHDVYTWQLKGKEFIHLDEVDNGSVFIDNTLKQWLRKVSPEQREQFINNVFEILQATNANTVEEIKERWLKNTTVIISTYKNMDEESKKMMVKTMEELFVIVKNNIKEKFKLPERNKKRG